MRASPAVATFFGFLFLAAVLAGLYYLVRAGLGLFAAVDADVTAIAAVATLALLISASLVANGLYAVARAGDQRQQRATRALVYEVALLTLYDGPAGERLLLHASPGVLNAYLRLRRVEATVGGGSARQETARLVRAMRRDLGQRAPDVAAGELADLLPTHEPGRV